MGFTHLIQKRIFPFFICIPFLRVKRLVVLVALLGHLHSVFITHDVGHRGRRIARIHLIPKPLRPFIELGISACWACRPLGYHVICIREVDRLHDAHAVRMVKREFIHRIYTTISASAYVTHPRPVRSPPYTQYEWIALVHLDNCLLVGMLGQCAGQPL